MDETWTITKADEEKINSLTTICYRKILGIDQVVDRISNEELLRRVNATDLFLEVQRRQLSKVGHKLRKPKTSMAHRYALYDPTHHQRHPGRPHPNFAANVASYIAQEKGNVLDARQIEEYAQNREEWRKMVKNRTKK